MAYLRAKEKAIVGVVVAWMLVSAKLPAPLWLSKGAAHRSIPGNSSPATHLIPGRRYLNIIHRQ